MTGQVRTELRGGTSSEPAGEGDACTQAWEADGRLPTPFLIRRDTT